MKTAPWSLALVATASAAVTADDSYGDGWASSSAPDGYSSVYASSSEPAGSSSVYASSSAPYYAVSSSAYSSSYGSGYLPSSSYLPTGFFSSSSAVGACESTYTSTCVETETLIYRSTTSYTSTTITHTLTTTLPECSASSFAGAFSSSSVPAAYPSGSAPAGYPSGSAPAGYSSESVTGAYSSSAPVVPASVSYSADKPSGPVIVTNTVTQTKTVCPCDDGGAAGGASGGVSGPTRTPGEVYTTETTTERITTCPDSGHEATYTYGDWTSVYTSYELSTITDTITTTLTEPYVSVSTGAAGYPSGPAGYPSGSSAFAVSSSADGYPSAYPSGSSAFPVSGSSVYVSSSVSYEPSGSSVFPVSGSASGSAPPYPSGSASGYPSGYPSGWAPTGVSSSYVPTGVFPSSSFYPSGTSPATPTASSCIPCEGQPGNNPDEWCGYDINTNWYEFTPKTCKTHEYYWTLTEEDISPDGVSRMGFVVNGQMPGPMIEANWGDTIIVHFTNGMSPDLLNGTSLHFHGIRQNGTNEMDGVSSITQCPIAPGHSMTYKWTASSYGTSWWHSHYALQTYEGVFGPMIINGPSAMDYDDEQMVILQDWNHATVDSLYLPSQFVNSPTSGPQTLDTGLINGMNLWEGAGRQFEMTVEPGKSYRLRLVNTAIQSTFVFYVDGHTFSVIAMDFVPITPYETEKVTINIGQRYDLIMKADQAAGDYWMRSDNQQPCGQLKNLDIKGIVHYSNGPNGTPDSQPYEYAPTCLDEPYENLNPIVALSAGAQSTTLDEDVAIAPWSQNPNLFKWTLSGTSFFAQWENPTLKSILDDGTVPTTSGNLAIEVPNLGEWVYVIVETHIPLPHPIHLHGHDFFILAQGLGVYNSGIALNVDNPPRRDVAVMPADPTSGTPGYLVVAFYTSNPGVWLMHCHIGWHNAMGFALQIIENLEGIKSTVEGQSMIDETCAAWTDYAGVYGVTASNSYDSGV